MDSVLIGLLTSLMPLILLSIPVLFVCRRLAKEKGKPVTFWTVLGIIPFVNIYAAWYLIGASNIRLEEKIDQVLKLLQKEQQ